MKFFKRVHFGCRQGMTSHCISCMFSTSAPGHGWAPCPTFPSWASGRGLEFWDWSLDFVWLTLEFPEQDLLDNKMIWDCLGKKATLKLASRGSRRKGFRDLWSSVAHAKLDREQTHIFYHKSTPFPINKLSWQPLGFIWFLVRIYHMLYLLCTLGISGQNGGPLSCAMVFLSWEPLFQCRAWCEPKKYCFWVQQLLLRNLGLYLKIILGNWLTQWNPPASLILSWW